MGTAGKNAVAPKGVMDLDVIQEEVSCTNSKPADGTSPKHRNQRGIVGKARRERINALARAERCGKCGFELKFPNLTVRHVYQQCPLCFFMIPKASPLGIPLPHPEMPNEHPWPLCEARVSVQGVARRCERRRVEGSDYCCKHVQALNRFGKLPYGRFSETYTEVHELKLEPDKYDVSAPQHTYQWKLSIDEKIAASKLLEREQVSKTSSDSMLLRTANNLLKRRVDTGALVTRPISTKELASALEPTFGIDLSARPEKLVWLKESFQALMALPKGPFAVLAATLGHTVDPEKSVSVTKALEELVKVQGGATLRLPANENLFELFACHDPCPGEKKWLRLRYAMSGTIGAIMACTAMTKAKPRTEAIHGASAEVKGCCYLEKTLSIGRHCGGGLGPRSETTTRLRISRAQYGHLHDVDRKFDVTENIQGLVDCSGDARYFEMVAGTKLNEIFGEPCKGVAKFLSLSYEIDSRKGEIIAPESHGFLIDPIFVSAPVVAPSLLITLATLSPRTLVGRSFGVKGDRKSALVHYQSPGSKSTRGRKTSIRCIDALTAVVTEHVQELVDSCGGDSLRIEAGHDVFFHVLSTMKSANMYRDMFAGKDLVLEVEYRANGKLATRKVFTDKDHILLSELCVRARAPEASLQIEAAVYGHPFDTTKQVNVVDTVQRLVQQRAGCELALGIDQNLEELFGDPCYPTFAQKALQVRYIIPKAHGTLTGSVGMKGDLLQTVRIGWPP